MGRVGAVSHRLLISNDLEPQGPRAHDCVVLSTHSRLSEKAAILWDRNNIRSPDQIAA